MGRALIEVMADAIREALPDVTVYVPDEVFTNEELAPVMRALQDAYSTISALIRTGAPLDDDWDSRLDQIYELAGDILYPDA